MAFDFEMETNIVCYEKTFKWQLSNFSKLYYNQMESLSFFPVIGSPIQLQVQLRVEDPQYIGGPGQLSVYLKTTHKKAVPQVRVTGKVSFKNSKGKLWWEKDFNTIMEGQNYVHCCGVSSDKCQLLSDICTLFDFSDDIFIVEISMAVSEIVTSVVTPVSILTRDEHEKVDVDSILKVIYKKNAFTDFTFQFGEENLRAHKAVLSTRSPVLEKMFEHDTSEKQTNSAAIEDIEFRIFDCFIEYIYTNEIREEIKADVEALLALYEVADKYEVSDLQKSCVDILLLDYLNVNTVCKLLHMADMHHDNSFKKAAMQFCRHRFSEVTKTPEWSQFMHKNIEIASEIVSSVTELVNNKSPR